MCIRDSQYGDANLDGVVNVIDEAAWNESRFSFGTGWATGDFNGDGLTDVSDFNVYNSNRTAVVRTVVLADTETDKAADQPTLETAPTTELASLQVADQSDSVKEAKPENAIDLKFN